MSNRLQSIPIGGICDIESAKAVARRLFETYDKDRNGQLDSIEVAPMMVDAYRGMSKGFNPSKVIKLLFKIKTSLMWIHIQEFLIKMETAKLP
jgi:hypothetical protein